MATREADLGWPDLVEDDIGWLVKDTGTHLVHVMRMIFNWRIARTAKPVDEWSGPDRAWCYYGTSQAAFVKAVLAAMAWDGADDTEPAGWDKNAMTGQYARPGVGQEAR